MKELKTKILNYINSKEYKSFKLEDFVFYFKENSKKEVEEVIDELFLEGDIFITKKNKIMSLNQLNFKKAKVNGITNNFIFAKVLEEEKDARINKKNTTEVVHIDDEVIVKDLGFDYELVKIIRRTKKKLIGEVKGINIKKYTKVFVSEDKRDNMYYLILEDLSYNLVEGHKIEVGIDEKTGQIDKIIEIIGHKNDPGVDIITKIKSYEVPYEFSKEILNEANEISREINSNERSKRKDLTDREIFTIDGEDAKDLDDAVECFINEEGNYVIGVHIADVTHYVKKDSLLEKEARLRGTSIYLCDRVIPMYPQIISNDICSLNEGEEKLTISCYIEVNANGKVISSEFFESIIKSKKRFTYKEVNNILLFKEENKNNIFFKSLVNLEKISNTLYKNNIQKGKLNLDINEAKIKLDDNGFPIEISLRERGVSENIIEECMVLANEESAKKIHKAKVPSLYRVHDSPTSTSLIPFDKIVRSLGVRNADLKKQKIHQYLNSVIYNFKDVLSKEIVSSIFLRNLPKAYYSEKNIGHFGLASKAYTHFTAPIRRYPDNIVHQNIRKYIINKEVNFSKEYKEYEEIAKIGEETSILERRAVSLERDIEDYKKTQFLLNQEPIKYKGRVSGFIERGFFVRLENTIEGLVKFEEINEERYVFIPEKFCAINKRNDNKIMLNDEVEVKVNYASNKEDKLSFTFLGKTRK